MKRTFCGCLLLVFSGCVTPAAQAPVPAPAKPAVVEAAQAEPALVVEGAVTEAHLGGLTVLVKRVPHAELSTVQLYARGGALNWSADNAGIEQLAFRVAATGGTTALAKSAFARTLAGLGAEVHAETTRDYSMLQAKGPTAVRTQLLALLADVFLRPALPESEVELARAQQLTALQQQDEDPDARLEVLVDSVRFKGHPYAVRPEGKAETVKALTRAQLEAHLQGLRQRSRLLVVAVGDVEAAELVAQAQALFGSLPEGAALAALPALPTTSTPTLDVEKRAIPTNYIEGLVVGPRAGTAEYAAGYTADTVLRERLFLEVRTKRNLSYAPSPMWELTGAGTYAGLYVTAVDANTTWKVMYDELRRLKTELVPVEELEGAHALARTWMFMRQESTDGQASSLAWSLLLTGDWRFREKLSEQLKQVKAEELRAYAQKYFTNLQVVLVGDPAKFDPAIARAL